MLEEIAVIKKTLAPNSTAFEGMNWLNSQMHSDESDDDSSQSDHSFDEKEESMQMNEGKSFCIVCDRSTEIDASSLWCKHCQREWSLNTKSNKKKCHKLDLIKKRCVEFKFSQIKRKKNEKHQLNWIGTNILGNMGNIEDTMNVMNAVQNIDDMTVDTMRVMDRFGIEHPNKYKFHPTHPLIIESLQKVNKSNQILKKHNVCPICQIDFNHNDDSKNNDPINDEIGIGKECVLEKTDGCVVHEWKLNENTDNEQKEKEEVNDGNVEVENKEEECIVRLGCGHIFHLDCIKPWLCKQNTCPLCRYELPSNNPNYELQRRVDTYDGQSVLQTMT